MAKTSKKAPEITYAQALVVNECLSSLTNRGIGVDSFVKFFQFKKALSTIIEDFYRMQGVLMSEYGVSAKGGTFDWTDHPEAAKITEVFNGLRNKLVTISPTNFMTAKELATATEGATMDAVECLVEILVVK